MPKITTIEELKYMLKDNFYQVGNMTKCGHCEPDKFTSVNPCECMCHNKITNMKSIDQEIDEYFKTKEADSRQLIEKVREEAFKLGQREYRQFMLNVLDGVDIADKEVNNTGGGTEAIRLAINSRII